LWERTLEVPTPEEFQARITGQFIAGISRRGKYLQFQLTTDWLLVHLRMSGDMLVEPDSGLLPVHHRLVLYLDQDLRLAFNDTRKFGRVWLVSDPDEVTAGLGPEPFDVTLTPGAFHNRLSATRRQIKPLLLDQKFLAGMGNIYTDEALHRTGLHPRRGASSLSYAEAEKLLKNIRAVLQAGIQHHGASIDWVYRGGDFQNLFTVYRRTGQPCRTCGTLIERIIVGQRSTHICPRCQPAENTKGA
jgi:formamidopyrimidine-DNA glycosylase